MGKKCLGGIAMALGLCMLWATAGCGGESAPTVMMSSDQPDFEQAARNASVYFLRSVDRAGGKLLDRDKAFAYSVSTFEDAAKKQALDREAFSRLFCDKSFIERENCLHKLIELKSGWPEGYAEVHKGMQELGFNLFMRWLSSGEMEKSNPAASVMSQRVDYAPVTADDEDGAFRNVALRILWLARQSGISPVKGHLDLQKAVNKVKEASDGEAFGKIMDRKMMIRCFSDRAFLEYLTLDEQMRRLLKEAPTEEVQQISNACLEAVGRVCAVLEKGLVKRGYIEAPKP